MWAEGVGSRTWLPGPEPPSPALATARALTQPLIPVNLHSSYYGSLRTGEAAHAQLHSVPCDPKMMDCPSEKGLEKPGEKHEGAKPRE